jgi:long-chain acyl-CoA synthetase
MTASADVARLGLAARIREMLALPSGQQQMLYDGIWYSWDAIRQAAAVAREMIADVERHAAVGVLCRNHPLVLGAVLGMLSDDRCVLPFPVLGSDEYIARELGHLRPVALLALDMDWEREQVSRAAADAGMRRIGIAATSGHEARFTVTPGTAGGAGGGINYPEGTAFVLQTSGTTGTPKRVPVSYGNLDAAIGAMRVRAKSATAVTDELRLRQSVAILNTPLSHTSGLLAFCLNVVEGRRLVLLDKFEPLQWAALVRYHRVASAGVPPAALAMLLDADIPAEWLSSLKMIRSGTAPLDPELAIRFEDHFGIPVVQAYGATEFQGVTAWSLPDYHKFGPTKRGSVGRALPGVRLRVTDPDTGAELPAGSVGRLEVNSAASSVSSQSGWASTNDRARVDADGFLWILGRLDDMINRGGLKVDSVAVARALQAHDWVTAAAVVGVPDVRLGEVPCAAVVLSEAAGDPSPQDVAKVLSDHLRAMVAPYMVPARYVVLDALPLNASLKVDRPAVIGLLR